MIATPSGRLQRLRVAGVAALFLLTTQSHGFVVPASSSSSSSLCARKKSSLPAAPRSAPGRPSSFASVSPNRRDVDVGAVPPTSASRRETFLLRLRRRRNRPHWLKMIVGSGGMAPLAAAALIEAPLIPLWAFRWAKKAVIGYIIYYIVKYNVTGGKDTNKASFWVLFNTVAGALSEEDDKLLHAYECPVCSYMIFPALGREERQYGANFMCPECGTLKEEFVEKRQTLDLPPIGTAVDETRAYSDLYKDPEDLLMEGEGDEDLLELMGEEDEEGVEYIYEEVEGEVVEGEEEDGEYEYEYEYEYIEEEGEGEVGTEEEVEASVDAEVLEESQSVDISAVEEEAGNVLDENELLDM